MVDDLRVIDILNNEDLYKILSEEDIAYLKEYIDRITKELEYLKMKEGI